MATQTPEPVAQPPTQPAVVGSVQGSTGFSAVARRVTGWTSNLLASAMVLVVTLATGRQVSDWLRAEPVAAPGEFAPLDFETAGGGWNEADPRIIEFGETQHSVQRASTQGDRAAALATLRDQARNVIRTEFELPKAVDSAESRLLERLSLQTPTEQQPGSWAIFDLDSPFPMVVGVRHVSNSMDSVSGSEEETHTRRLVACGIALPAGDDRWTLFTFQRGSLTAGAAEDPLRIPIPSGGSHTLTMRSKSGDTITAFGGTGQAAEYVRFYDDWFRSNRWSAATGWHRAGDSWSARFTTEQPMHRTADVHIATDEQGRLSGLCCTTSLHTNSEGR